MTSANPVDRVSSNPTSPTTANLSTENSAFFAAPVFKGTTNNNNDDLPAHETTTAMLDIKSALPNKETSSPETTTNPTAVAIETSTTTLSSTENNEAMILSPVTPLSPIVSATSPLLTPAQPTVALTISTTIMSDSDDTEIEVTEEGQIYQQQESETAAMDMDEVDLVMDVPNGATAVPATTESILSSSAMEILPNGEDSKFEELQKTNEILLASLDETRRENEHLHREKDGVDRDLYHTRTAYHELHRQYTELQQKFANKERDYETMSKNYLEHVRAIRATDDDHGTIMDKLTQLKASIEHLIRKAQGGRSVNLNKTAAIEYLKGAGMLEGFPIEEDKLEAYHLNLFMESVVMSELIKAFFEKHLSCIFDHNQGFKDIYEWMYARNDKLAVRWRQHLCVLLTRDPKTKKLQEEVVEKVATSISEDLAKIYTNSNEVQKLRDLCSKAFDLSVAMTGLENVISPVTMALGTPYDEETMAPSLKSDPEGKVALVIFPAFKDTQNAFNVRPKVWCC
ncbi:hypothetical protein BGZ83_007830 [Gryganskiella cystojenkinii]|nr:hypothetical protein BGZ83_007830 [Gryganskiella cystojenkinii]